MRPPARWRRHRKDLMTTDAYIRVICDGCFDEEEIQITAVARGWDNRNVEGDIKRLGWKTVGDKEHYCANCAPKEKTHEEEEE